MSRGSITYDAQLRLTLEGELKRLTTTVAERLGVSSNEFIREAIREKIKKEDAEAP